MVCFSEIDLLLEKLLNDLQMSETIDSQKLIEKLCLVCFSEIDLLLEKLLNDPLMSETNFAEWNNAKVRFLYGTS